MIEKSKPFIIGFALTAFLFAVIHEFSEMQSEVWRLRANERALASIIESNSKTIDELRWVLINHGHDDSGRFSLSFGTGDTIDVDTMRPSNKLKINIIGGEKIRIHGNAFFDADCVSAQGEK
jgi:hypothetical protein